MKTLALVLLLAVSAQAQSRVWTLGPMRTIRYDMDTVTAGQALNLIKPDSTNYVYHIGTGDMNGDGRVALSDVIYLAKYVLLDGPAPKGELVMQMNVTTRPDSMVMVQVIVADTTVSRK